MAADNPNLAETQSMGGKTIESDPPKAPDGKNSSVVTQEDGSSLAKNAQGVLKNTMTEINNLIPVAGCPIKLPNLLNKLNTRFKLWPESESNKLKAWAEKIAKEFFAPIVDQVEGWIKAIKAMIKELMGYIKKITDLIKEIQEVVKAIAELAAFILSLPARLAQLISNCLKALTDGVTKYVSGALTDLSSGFNAGLSQGTLDVNSVTSLSGTGISMVPTSSNIDLKPPQIKTVV